ncbi:UNVERIFIED_CONTAM: hypothetical protein NCL1_19419 [Trichonephila clavipes]
MREAGWSARRIDRQLDRSDCVVSRCWDQWIRKMSFTRRPGSGCPRQTRAPVYFRTIQRHLGEGHLRSQRPLRVLCLTPTYRSFRLEWCHARGNWTAADWNQVVLGDESRFSLSSDGNHVSAWRPREEHLNPAFAKQ